MAATAASLPPNPDGHQPPVDPREEQVLALRAAAGRLEQAERDRDAAFENVKRLAAEASDDRNPYRLGMRTIGDAVGRDGMTVFEWLHGHPTARHDKGAAPRGRCRARAGHTGARCRALARTGRATCWHHRDVPDDQLLPDTEEGEVDG